MRITNRMMTYNFLSSLNKSLERQNEIQEQLSDGKAIHRPSDDPIKTVRSLRFNTNLVMNEQYTQNLKDAMSWMDTTDGAMSDTSSLMIRVRELVTSADGTKTGDDYKAIGAEIDKIIDQMVNIGNTKLGDRYIFAGQKDKSQPFTRNGDVITYNGDNNKISMPIQPGLATPNQDSVNVTGTAFFGANMKIFTDLINIKNDLISGKPPSDDALGLIEQDHNAMLQVQTELGTRMSVYEMAQNMMEQENVTITGDVSANEDLDIPKAIIDFKNSENVYKMALSVGARIMPPTLADFLK